MIGHAPLRVRIQHDPLFPSSTNERARRDGGSTDIYTIGHHVIDWIETHCVLTESHYAGQPFVLMDWQRRALLELFEVVPAEDEAFTTGYRPKHRWALIGIPKKNGKTELCAALALFFVIGDDEPSPLVVCAAAADEQADLVFGAARRMCEWSDTLQSVTTCFESEIEVPSKKGARLKRVAASAGTQDGKNVYAAVIDELHEWKLKKQRDTWDILTQGGGARRTPINVQITTAGNDEETICFEQYEHAQRVIHEGDDFDPGFYAVWFEAPADCDHKDLSVLPACNPSFGLILQEPFYEDMLTKRSEAVYRRYFLNQWTEAEEIWEAAQLWDQLPSSVTLDTLDPDKPIFVGMDKGRRNDSSAVIVTQWTELDGEPAIAWVSKVWENPYPFHDARHNKWSFPTAELEQYCRELYERFPEPAMQNDEDEWMPGPAFGYDPHMLDRSAELLEGDGLHMVEYPQTDARMVPASSAMFDLVKRGLLLHDGHPTVRKHVRSVVAKEKERGWRISRPTGSRKHIDACVAGAMSVFLATMRQREEADKPGVW